jgi:transposase
MGFSVVCHVCGEILYEGRDMIPLYRLRRKTDGKCPCCGRRLAADPIEIIFKERGS